MLSRRRFFFQRRYFSFRDGNLAGFILRLLRFQAELALAVLVIYAVGVGVELMLVES
jgi:hypothetical protein